MTTYEITPKRITIQGHAGYSTAGSDIVCAAVSTLHKMLKDGLEMSGAGFICSERPEVPSLTIDLGEMTDDAYFVLELFEREMDDVAYTYPQYVQRTESRHQPDQDKSIADGRKTEDSRRA